MEREILMKHLQEMGLSEWEARCYFALVKYGPKTALELSKLAEIARSKTYEVATRLRKKGLVMKVPPMPAKGITQKFAAIDPEKVFNTKMVEMKEASVELAKLYKTPVNPRFPKISFYNSKKATKELLLSLLNKKEKVYFYIYEPGVLSSLEHYLQTYLELANKKNIEFFISENPATKILSSKIKQKKSLGKVSGNNLIIYSDKVIMDLWEDQYSVVEITSAKLVNTFLTNLTN